jgi:L-iditol 2-dehydrogenase
MMLAQRGCQVVATDTIPARLDLSRQSGAFLSLDPRKSDVNAELKRLTENRGADLVFVATAVPGLVEQALTASRPGARICLFAQTSDKERIDLSGSSICVGERMLFGSYSASVDLQKQSADLVFSRALPVKLLISHRVPLANIKDAFALATNPTESSLKIIVQCNQV